MHKAAVKGAAAGARSGCVLSCVGHGHFPFPAWMGIVSDRRWEKACPKSWLMSPGEGGMGQDGMGWHGRAGPSTTTPSPSPGYCWCRPGAEGWVLPAAKIAAEISTFPRLLGSPPISRKEGFFSLPCSPSPPEPHPWLSPALGTAEGPGGVCGSAQEPLKGGKPSIKWRFPKGKMNAYEG